MTALRDVTWCQFARCTFTIVTLYTYVTSGPIKGDLAST